MINLCAKKVYCSDCQKLVRVKQQKAGERVQFSCMKCDKIIWQKQGLGWKHQKEI